MGDKPTEREEVTSTALTETLTLTDRVIERVRQALADGAGVTQAVAEAVSAEAVRLEGGPASSVDLLDSHKLAAALFEMRRQAGTSEVDRIQTRCYVQHVLREALHVCRHALGGGEGLYRVHRPVLCSPDCAEVNHRDTKPAEESGTKRRVCPNCFMQILAAPRLPRTLKPGTLCDRNGHSGTEKGRVPEGSQDGEARKVPPPGWQSGQDRRTE